MSLIRDVVSEVKSLDVSSKSVQKFGMVVGSVFVLFAFFLFWKDLWMTARVVFLIVGTLLWLGGFLRSNKNEMKIVYRVWMAFAFTLGWIMSRLILIILFVFILTPIGVIAKVFRKNFLDLKYKKGTKSYWIQKEKRKIDYEKMY